ncbi:hypothetical protein FHR92_005163 [Fontibacillus solani]|uniref:Uncharacterized protein n=1 Tax=Fontibacillus solani TaxID=1572857 RepID=A0A7W3SYR8_9BACL|nr:hypothetical protein [Fontibacillus solani]MBA9088645.1 hypothetical protein [Fontibacillus solani]
MATWADVPKVQGPPQTNDVAVLQQYVKKLADVTARMAKDLEFILNGNVAFDNIKTNGIEAKNIKAEAITAEKIQAGAVVAEKIDVNELSAISANLGHITAGLIEAVQIFGSYIATRNGTFPRCEMSSENNLFGAFSSADNSIQMYPDSFGQTLLVFNTLLRQASMYLSSSGLIIATPFGFGDIQLSAGDDLRLNAGGNVMVRGWGRLYSIEQGQTLLEALEQLSDRITALGG